MRRLGLRGLLAWSGLAVSAALAYVAVRDVDLHGFWSALASANLWLLLPAAVTLAIGLYLKAIRWRLLFGREPRPPLGAVASALLIGYLFNSILPARAGEAARVVALNQRARISRFEGLATVVAERVLDVLVLLLLLLTSAPFMPEATWMRRATIVGGVAFVPLTALLILLAFYGRRPALFALRPLATFAKVTPERVEHAAANLVHGLAVFRRATLALQAVAATALSWLLIALSFWLCMLCVRLDTGFDAALLVVIAVNLAMILPSGPAGLGVWEAATVLTLSPFGIDRSHALSYAVVVHVLNYLPLVVVGYLALHHHALVVRRSRRSTAFSAPPSLGGSSGSDAGSNPTSSARGAVIGAAKPEG